MYDIWRVIWTISKFTSNYLVGENFRKKFSKFLVFETTKMSCNYLFLVLAGTCSTYERMFMHLWVRPVIHVWFFLMCRPCAKWEASEHKYSDSGSIDESDLEPYLFACLTLQRAVVCKPVEQGEDIASLKQWVCLPFLIQPISYTLFCPQDPNCIYFITCETYKSKKSIR